MLKETVNKKLELVFYSDPSHGWVAVPISLLEQLNIKNKFSTYSYISRDKTTAYLEEDCDAGLLIRTLENKKVPYTVRTVNCNQDSFIRKLPRYNFNSEYNYNNCV